MKDYKRILQGVVNIINITKKSDIGFANICAYIDEKCPELKESEGERIRKELICYFEKYPSIVIGPFNTKECIAWLEKQSTPQVRTGLEWVNTIDDACDKRYLEEYAHGEYCNEQSFKWGFQEGVDWLEKQGEQKPVEPSIPEIVDEHFHEMIDNEQKHVEWSEEDEKIRSSIIDFIRYELNHSAYIGTAGVDSARQIEWLKSLKDRVQPQSKQEWSEEDERKISWIIAMLQNSTMRDAVLSMTNDECIDWLKSLRPQNRWKPSDEQIRAFEWAYKSSKIEEGSQYDIDCKDLLEQLKAL